MESAAQSLLSILSSWWRKICTFFCCLAAFLQGESWFTARGASSALYHDVKTHDLSTTPLAPVREDDGMPGLGDDLESGLSAGNGINSVVSLHHSLGGPTDSSTSGISTPATPSPVLVLTSSILSPFILEGRGITLSESAKVLLSSGALSPMTSEFSEFVHGPVKNEVPSGGMSEGTCGERGREPIHSVVNSPTWSPSLTVVGTSSPAPSTSCFPPCQNIDTPTTPSGTTEVRRDREEAEKGNGCPKVSPRPRPPSAVRHSLKFSVSPQTFVCLPGVAPIEPSIQATEPALIPPSLSMSHSVSTLRSLQETSDVFRGALVTDGDDVHLPSSLSAPEPRYYEFYYDYYCQEPVLPLDAITENAIRKSLLMLSPVLVVPSMVECSDLNTSSPRDAENRHSLTPRLQGRATNFISCSSSPASWNTALNPRVPSMASSISASLFAFPTFPSTSVSASIDSAGDESGDEDEDYPLAGQDVGTFTALNSPSSSFYVDSDTGSTSRELVQDSDRTLQTVGEAKGGKLGSDSSTSSEGSTIGSEDSLALSGEATLVHAKRGSLFKPIVLMRMPGTRESVALDLNPPPYSERNFTELNSESSATLILASQERRLIEDHGHSRASINSIEETFALLSPPTKCSLIGLAKDDEEEKYDMSDDESDVEWLAWPRDSRRNAGRRMEGDMGRTHVHHDTPMIPLSSSRSVTIFNGNHRRTPQSFDYTTISDPYLNASHFSNPTAGPSSLRQIIVSQIQDPRSSRLAECYHTSVDSLATLSTSPVSNARFFPGSRMNLRSSVVVQMGDTRVPVSSTPQRSLPTRDGLGSLRVSLTVSDRRYPTFIPANVPFPRPTGVPAARVESDVDHYDEEYESAAGRGLESSGSTSTVKPSRVREDIACAKSYSKAGGEDLSRRYRARHGRQKSGEADTRKPTAYGAPRTFITFGVDSEDEDVPLRYSGALAL